MSIRKCAACDSRTLPIGLPPQALSCKQVQILLYTSYDAPGNDRRLGCLCDKMMYRLEPSMGSPRRSPARIRKALSWGYHADTSSTSTLATANTQKQRRPQIARLPPITRNLTSQTALQSFRSHRLQIANTHHPNLIRHIRPICTVHTVCASLARPR